MPSSVTGLLLAAGAGRRMGQPKALVRSHDGTAWVVAAVRLLGGAGCDPVRVVLGSGAQQAAALLSDAPAGQAPDAHPDVHTDAHSHVRVDVRVTDDWEEGMGASLRAGLSGLADLAPGAVAALVHLVDLPDVGPDVMARVMAHAGGDVLARAFYGGAPGHPVLLGRDHWAGVAATARGDAGARTYLARREVVAVECGDLASGVDVDSR